VLNERKTVVTGRDPGSSLRDVNTSEKGKSNEESFIKGSNQKSSVPPLTSDSTSPYGFHCGAKGIST